jgi:transposase-like protein
MARSVRCPFCKHDNTSLEHTEHGIHRYSCGACGKFFAYAAGDEPREHRASGLASRLKFPFTRKRDAS